jgi:phosphate acetyltransferase
MRVVTAGSMGLRTARRITHVFIMNVPTHSDTLFITDAAINIFPDLEAKRDSVQNAVVLYTQIGLGMRRVGILSAVETVTPKIPSTIDAAALCKMGDCGQITGGVLDGRLAFDNASAHRRRREKASSLRSRDAMLGKVSRTIRQ